MTATSVFFDTWAWVELFEGTSTGQRLARYEGLDAVHTSVVSIAELSARLSGHLPTPQLAALLDRVQARAKVHPIEAIDARGAGALRSELRKASKHASTIDALILAAATRLGMPLISGDPAFKGQPNVRAD